MNEKINDILKLFYESWTKMHENRTFSDVLEKIF
jgi:predicted CopG family antitoxin